MNNNATEQITFDVETGRILEILASEIYDSPQAFLRENVQNAYDAILMRRTAQQMPVEVGRIEITLHGNRVVVSDNGIGMNEAVLRDNFWRAGSSGKKSELAQRSGVIGTFGIGAMANFGVCTSLQVETRHIESEITLISTAQRDQLKIAQECIDLQRIADSREPGTSIIANLDPMYSLSESAAKSYLRQYVRFLPIPVSVNGSIISQDAYYNTLRSKAQDFEFIDLRAISMNGYGGSLNVAINRQGRVLIYLNNILLQNRPIKGDVFFVQENGPTHTFRNLFGLAHCSRK